MIVLFAFEKLQNVKFFVDQLLSSLVDLQELGVFAEAADEGTCNEVELHGFHACEDYWEEMDLLLLIFLLF